MGKVCVLCMWVLVAGGWLLFKKDDLAVQNILHSALPAVTIRERVQVF